MSVAVKIATDISRRGLFIAGRNCRYYAAPVAGGMGGPTSRPRLDVERDPHKLCTRLCGGNFMNDGEPDPALGAKEDYPDWLWDLHIEREPIPVEQLDKNSQEYWDRLMKEYVLEKRKTQHIQHKYRRFKKLVPKKPFTAELEYHRALEAYHENN